MPEDLSSIVDQDLGTRCIGRQVLYFDCVGSTNTVAAGYAAHPAKDGLVIIADRQTAGRGRQGRTWISQAGKNILLSVLLFPPKQLTRPVILTTMAAVAVCESIYEAAQLQARIKWPNDILINGRKVCGILVEQGRGVVIGIGLNVNTPADAFVEAGLSQACSLAMFAGCKLDRLALAQALIRRLDVIYRDLLDGQVADLEARWRWNSGLLGKSIEVASGDCRVRGRLVDIGFSGIHIRSQDGKAHEIKPEAVETITLLGNTCNDFDAERRTEKYA